MNNIILSIIIPCYNAEPYINELLQALKPQVTNETQVIVIDDGSDVEFKCNYKWVQVIRQANLGASAARNAGLDNAIGEYVAFIDADDIIAGNYVSVLLDKIKKEKFDYCYLSWRTMPGGWQQEVQLKTIGDTFPPFNLCVWNRVYRRDMIGNVRFNTKKLIAEDAEFIRDVKEEGKKKAFVSDFMYYYRSSTPNSLTKRFSEGKVNTKRIVYYYPIVKSDMTHLINEFEEANKEAEIILMTNENQIPELANYAMVIKPCKMKGTELRGTNTSLFSKVNLPIVTQVVIYTQKTFNIGGIETWIYNFCAWMKEYYDILVLYDYMDIEQINRLRELVQVEKNDIGRTISCDTAIVNRITDVIPSNIGYKQKIQMVHACKMSEDWHVPKNYDYIVSVSDVAYNSFKSDIDGKHEVINNLTFPKQTDGALILVSATRLSTFEKGQSRMIKLAKMFNERGIPFIWIYFADRKLPEEISGMIRMMPTLNVVEYVKQADYLVQLSDAEGFCYSIVEALEVGTPVITTPLEVLSEIGVIDGKNGYVVPFDMEDVDIDKIYYKRLKGFKYEYDNASRIKQWRNILGSTKPSKTYNPINGVRIRIIKKYMDIELGRVVEVGEILYLRPERSAKLESSGYGVIEV